MTPKEKAEELVNKMKYPMNGVYVISHVANELALIAVDEILKNDTIFLYVHHLDFWQQVKQEIEKL
jgi:hypothetical protein